MARGAILDSTGVSMYSMVMEKVLGNGNKQKRPKSEPWGAPAFTEAEKIHQRRLRMVNEVGENKR